MSRKVEERTCLNFFPFVWILNNNSVIDRSALCVTGGPVDDSTVQAGHQAFCSLWRIIFIVLLPFINLPWLLIVYRINSKLLRPQSFKIYLSVPFKLHCSSVLPLALCWPKLLAATVCMTDASMAPSCTHPCPLPGLSSSVSSSWPPSSYTSPDFTLWKKVWKSLSRGWLFVTPWTIQFMEFSRPEYWSG